MEEKLNGVIAIVSKIEQLWEVIQKYFVPKKDEKPCPCCRKPKPHHTKCQTPGCRLFKEWLRSKYVGVYGSLAWEVGAHEKYHKHRIQGQTLQDILKMLPAEKLKEMQAIVASASSTNE